ncbi:MAG: diacylglycerol kinase [bacterium]|nr:diacylglycerol kinase [bacterium]
MKRFSLIRSFNYAIQGVIYVLKTQRNMQIHFIAGAIVFLLSLFLDLTKVELIAISFAISLVLICEMVNTAIETGLNIISSTYNHLARMAKDISAGAVLVASFNAIIVGYLTLYPRLAERSITPVITKIKETPTHLTFISLILVIVCVIICKAFSKKGTFMRGGCHRHMRLFLFQSSLPWHL